jgi:large subunit ribosomal protein L10
MLRAQKPLIVDAIKSVVEASSHLIVVHNLALTPQDMDKIRAKLRENNAGLRVIKNSLATIALKGTAHEAIITLLQGPTAIFYSNDLVSLAKSVTEFAKQYAAMMNVLGGSMEGEPIDQNAVQKLSTLPSLDQLRAKIIGLVSAPAQKIVGITLEPASQLARVINAFATK